MKRFWIFVVTGGEPFEIEIKGNPRQIHDGQRSILRALITDEQAPEVEERIRSYGATVMTNSPREDDQAKEERRNLLNLSEQENTLPCARCLECSYFDTSLVGLCGAGRGFEPGESWDPVVLKNASKQDLELCPRE